MGHRPDSLEGRWNFGEKAPSRVVLTEDPYNQPEDAWMEFRLTYQGPLLATQREPQGAQRDQRGDHKHEIRRTFHRQLKRLWEVNPFLKTGVGSGPSPMIINTGDRNDDLVLPPYEAESLAAKHAHYGIGFVPLVTAELNLLCGLDILFLRPDKPGKLWRGDIDNRIKTLLDALRVPKPSENYHQRTLSEDEKPFFCLLEDDELITKLSIETDELLEFTTPGMNLEDARLIITVHLRPYELHRTASGARPRSTCIPFYGM